jgi:hypothetical protein
MLKKKYAATTGARGGGNSVKRANVSQGRIQEFKLGAGSLKKKCAERREARKYFSES